MYFQTKEEKKTKSTQLETTTTNLTKEQIQNKLFTLMPKLIQQAEQLFKATGSGQTKILWVLNKLQEFCYKSGVELNEQVATEQIESILATPQKKPLTTTEDNATPN